MTTVCTCGFIFESGTFPPLDRTLVIRAVSSVRVLGKQSAELAEALAAVAVTLAPSLASLDPVISRGLQLFRDIASVPSESELISEFSCSRSTLKTTG